MYDEKYGIPYTFVPQNPNPYSSKECKDAWKLIVSFGNDLTAVRKYIYWLFKKQLSSNTDIVSFNYINAAGLIRKYKIHFEKNKGFSRSSKVPSSLVSWCESHAPEVLENYELSTMNDLGALVAYYNKFKESAGLGKESLVISKAEQLGLIKNGKLNIRG